MKREIFSVFLALVLAVSLLMVPTAVSANGTTYTLAGSTIEIGSLADPYETQDETAFNAEPHTTVVDDVAFDAQSSSQVVIEGTVSALDLGAGWLDTAYVEIGLRPEATMDARNAGVYLIAFNLPGDPGETVIHLQDYTGNGNENPDETNYADVINISKDSDFQYEIILTPSGGIGGSAILEVWVGDESQGTATLDYGYVSTWNEHYEVQPADLNEDFSEAYLFYSIIAECRGAGNITYSATVGDITIDDTLYVGEGQQFSTIQAAIDFANPGDTVNVAAGIYSEWQDNGYGASAGNIIDKPLHLQGSGDDCIIRGKTGTTSYMGYSPIVWVKADNVEIDHFKFDGATYTEEEPKGLRSYGILSAWKVDSTDYAATNLNVHHNTFVFIGTAVTQDRAGGGDITVAYNTMVRETRSIWYKPAGATPGAYVDKTLGGGGVKFDYVVGGSVHDNTGIETPGIGISLYGCEGLTIGPGNVISAPNTTDPSDAGIYINGGSNITVTSNTVSNFKNGEDPMYNCGKKGAGISIYSGGCDSFTIENNDLTNNSVGVYVATVESMDTPTNVKVHSNNIEGNDDYGVCNFRFPGGMKDPATGEKLKYWEYDKFSPANNDADATNNWWGSASGPTHASNTYTVPAGDAQGDAVSDYVDYVPWCNIDKAGASFAPVENTDTGEQFSSIQVAIDDADTDANDTINVAAGTYAEEITIGKANLTLQSESKWGAIIRPTTTPANFGVAIYISADGVTVDGFEIDGTTVCKNGILGWETSGLTIKNNKIHGAVNAWDGCGILLFSWGNSGTVHDNLIEGNEVYDTGRMGIMVCDYDGTNYTLTSGNIITGNTVYDVWKKATAWDDHGGGIQINVAKDCSITNNEVYDVQDGQRGIYMYGSATGNTIEHNTLRDNPIGIQLWISGEGGGLIAWEGETATSPQVHYNNIYDNSEGAISTNKEGTPMVMDATYNWWGHASGPDRELINGKRVGKGNKVSDNVDYKPWLHKSKEKAKKKPAYAQSVDLDKTGEYGWNTFSAPIFLDEEADTWAELYALADELAYSLAYRFDSDNQTFVPLTKTDDYAINPGEGFFIKMDDVGSLPLLYSTEENLMPPSRPLTAGWNLIGLANLDEMDVEDAFASIAEAPGLAGYSQVVSPIGNAKSGPVLADGTIYVGESYWVYMLGERTLAGFTMTPVDWVP